MTDSAIPVVTAYAASPATLRVSDALPDTAGSLSRREHPDGPWRNGCHHQLCAASVDIPVMLAGLTADGGSQPEHDADIVEVEDAVADGRARWEKGPCSGSRYSGG